MKMDFTSPEVTQSRSSKVAIPTTTFNRTFPSFQAYKAYKLSHSTLPSLPSTSKMSSVNVCTQAQLDAAIVVDAVPDAGTYASDLKLLIKDADGTA